MKHRITVILEDGIGREVTTAAQRWLKAAGVEIEWEVVEEVAHAIENYNNRCLRPYC
jgi:isocitrate/isopropylmalate dehydrogenase